MLELASIGGFFGTVWWTALVGVVCFVGGYYFSKKIDEKLDRGN